MTPIAVVVVGTAIMFLLVLSIFLLVILHQKRMLRHQLQLGDLEAKKQREILQVTFLLQEAERRRLAEELHDSVGQVLSTVKLNLHRLEEKGRPGGEPDLLRATRLLTEESIQEIRRIIHDVHPPLLTDFGLVAALEDLCGKVNASGGLRVTFRCTVRQLPWALPAQVSLYRMVQELFNNTIRHAAARHVELTLEHSGEGFRLSFRDDGVGFDAERAARESRGLGLRNLRSRVDLLGGTLHLTSRPGEGTLAVILLRPPRSNDE
jgi:signal transduction histidine kinase